MSDITTILNDILRELREIKDLIRRQTYLFEKYDTEVFEEEELLRELQQTKNNKR